MSQFTEVFQSINFVKEHEGWQALPGFVIAPFYENITGYILKGSLKDAVAPIPPKLPVIIREATPDDQPRFSRIVPPLRARRFAAKMKAGESCAFALLDDKVISFVWASFAGQATSKDVPFELGPKDTYLWGAYCLPEYRQHGIHSSVASFHEDLLRQRGYETSYRFTKFSNEAVLKLCKKLGVKAVGKIHGVRIFGRRFFRYHLETLE
jgi:ribosomal protein S18 acetylase RimI-like enzyme